MFRQKSVKSLLSQKQKKGKIPFIIRIPNTLLCLDGEKIVIWISPQKSCGISKFISLLLEDILRQERLLKDGKKIAVKKPVTIGQLYDDNIEILSGLVSGDQIIIQGHQNLYEGQLIEDSQK